MFFIEQGCQILIFKLVFDGKVTLSLCIFVIHSTQPINILRPWIYQIEIYLLSRQQTASVCVL